MCLESLQKMIASEFPNYLQDLEYITNIDSSAKDKLGSQKIAEFLAEKLKSSGAKTEFVNNASSTHLIARFRGAGTVKILMVAHIDTVFDTGAAEQRPFRMDENKCAYGPGVGDDKATVIQTVYIMKALRNLAIADYGEIIIYYNGQEEIGAPAAEKLMIKLAQEVDLCIVMDTARPNWGIVTKRKGRATYRIDVTGKAGHAGNATLTAASATIELANQILKFHDLATTAVKPAVASAGRVTPPTSSSVEKLSATGDCEVIPATVPAITVNVGIIGTKNDRVNVVPADAFAEIEIRAFDLADLKRIDQQIPGFCNNRIVPEAKVTITGAIQNVPLEKTPQVKILADLYCQIVRQTYQIEVREEAAGGVTDGNIAAIYIPTLDGVGIENYAEHTDQEWVDLKTVVPRTVVLILLIKELCQKWPLW
jgi:glutamate carboxypeptidase